MQCRMFELHVPDKPRFFNFLAPEILRNIDNFFAAAERIPTRPSSGDGPSMLIATRSLCVKEAVGNAGRPTDNGIDHHRGYNELDWLLASLAQTQSFRACYVLKHLMQDAFRIV